MATDTETLYAARWPMPFTITNLGERTIKSPLLINNMSRGTAYISDNKRMRYDVMIRDGNPGAFPPEEVFEIAGQREMIFFEPSNMRCAIVSCGGLCPGINDVIRSIVMELFYRYGCTDIIGIRYGYNGLHPDTNFPPIELTPQMVNPILRDGGSVLGSSRGGTADMELLVDSLERLNVSILFTIGGDGTLRGAHNIAQIAIKRGLKLSVIGIPKTIDNDISYIQRSFGFETAFTRAVDSIYSAHVEAEGAPNGIGLVKLMGRHSGYIATSATLAMNHVNFVLIPEVPFEMDGPNGFLRHLEDRLRKRNHAVICVAEGAGQELIQQEGVVKHDASGNLVLEDIGQFMKKRISEYFTEKNIPINLKYIDPSYMIRSSPATANDSLFCTLLGQYAVHAGMAGKTDCIIGLWNNVYTHVPIELAISRRKTINPNSRFYNNVIEATGQAVHMLNGEIPDLQNNC